MHKYRKKISKKRFVKKTPKKVERIRQVCSTCQAESLVVDKNGNKICRNCERTSKIYQKLRIKQEGIKCPYCGYLEVAKEGSIYVCQNCTSEVAFNKNEVSSYGNRCPTCDSENYEKKGFRNEKQRYVCKDCGRNWTSNGVIKSFVPRKPKIKDTFQRENTLEETIAYLKKQEVNNMPLKFWYRDDTTQREVYDYFVDEKYVQVRSDKGYYIKFLVDKIRKIEE